MRFSKRWDFVRGILLTLMMRGRPHDFAYFQYTINQSDIEWHISSFLLKKKIFQIQSVQEFCTGKYTLNFLRWAKILRNNSARTPNTRLFSADNLRKSVLHFFLMQQELLNVYTSLDLPAAPKGMVLKELSRKELRFTISKGSIKKKMTREKEIRSGNTVRWARVPRTPSPPTRRLPARPGRGRDNTPSTEYRGEGRGYITQSKMAILATLWRVQANMSGPHATSLEGMMIKNVRMYLANRPSGKSLSAWLQKSLY